VYRRFGLGLSLFFCGSALAASLPLAPGRSIQAVSCQAKKSGPCFRKAQRLLRFAAEPQADIDPEFADVRLAWQGTALLVRARGLSDTQHIEVVVSQSDVDDLAAAQLIILKNEIVRHPLSPAPQPGQKRAIRLNLRDSADGTTRTWSPVSDGNLTRAATVWFTEDQKPSLEITVDAGDEGWTVDAPKNTQLVISHRRAVLPRGGRGISPPWSMHTKPGVSFEAPPHTGWYDIRATQGEGRTARHGTAALYWQANAGERLQSVGIHPAPKSVIHGAGEPFVLTDTSTICADDPSLRPAAEWLKTELKRLTGLEVSLSCGDAPSIRLSTPASAHAHPDGYTISARKEGIQLHATGRAAALYAAIATADLVGFDNAAPPVDIDDWPTVSTRVLYHEVSPLSGPMVSPEQTLAFIDKVVARARINVLILEMKGGYQSTAHPELSRAKGAWSQAALKRVIARARSYGMEVIPALNTPAHTRWITTAHPELMEEDTALLLCTRNPETRVLIESMYRELIDIFDHPRFVHIGHDEINWRTHRKHESQRCIRCQGTPRWQLLTEDLLWHHKTLANMGAKPMMWSDMLVAGWNGKEGGIHRVTNRIPESIRPDFTVMSWGRVGDTVGNLVPKGYPVIRGNTGYADWKREGLADIAQGLAGEALALFNPTPWSSFEGMAGDTRLYHHWSNVILAGATAWEPRIEYTAIDTALFSLLDLPAYQPGFKAWPKGAKLKSFLNKTEPAVAHDLALGRHIEIGEMRYSPAVFFKLKPGESETYTSRRKLHGLSIVQAVSYSSSAQPRLSKDHLKSPHQGGVTVGEISITYADKTTTVLPMVLGMNTNRMNAPIRGALLFDGAGMMRVSSQALAAIGVSAPQQALYRLDWHNPRPDQPVSTITLSAVHDDLTIWVAGLAMAINTTSPQADD
jgi:hypothetical protein